MKRSLFQTSTDTSGVKPVPYILPSKVAMILIGLGDLRLVRVGLELVGQIDEEAGAHEVGHVDQIKGNEIRDLAALHAGREFGDHLVVGNDGQCDLVVMTGIPQVDHVLSSAGAAGADPLAQLGRGCRRNRHNRQDRRTERQPSEGFQHSHGSSSLVHIPVRKRISALFRR